MAEPGNKLFQQVSNNRQENGSIETIVLPESDTAFLNYFVNIEIPKLVRVSQMGGIFLDFGCGNGSMLSLICDSLQAQRLNQKLQIVGYDPNFPKFDENSRIGRKKKFYNINYVTNLPERADVVVAHFSLHHAGNIEEELKKLANLGVAYITIAEYDFSKLGKLPEDQAVEEFQKVFKKSEAGKADYENFYHQAIRSGGSANGAWRDCYLFHQKYSRKDFIRALKSAGYSPTCIVLPSDQQDEYKFIITAKHN